MTDDTETVTEKPEEPGNWFTLMFFGLLVVGLPYFVVTGELKPSDKWWRDVLLFCGWLVAINMVLNSALGIYYRRHKLEGTELSDKVGDRTFRFWWALIKWVFYASAAITAYIVYSEQFEPASSTNKLLVVVAILLVCILFALLRIGDAIKSRKD